MKRVAGVVIIPPVHENQTTSETMVKKRIPSSREKDINKALTFIRHLTDLKPRLAITLGSGFGSFGDTLHALTTIPCYEIPNYPSSNVQGHAGKLHFGYLKNDSTCSTPLLVFQGRVHFYEIASMEEVLFPVYIAYQLGIQKLIITNAAGGINSHFEAGDLMLIQDILNLAFLCIPAVQNHSSIPSGRYLKYFNEKMTQRILHCALQSKIPLQQGTYGWLRGPSFETPAEIQMLRRIGVDAVGMSTVPELFAARNLGMEAIGISLVSNLASGISLKKLSHADVMETGAKAARHISELLEQFILAS
jgi:purine-nucleoside phosphorylase